MRTKIWLFSACVLGITAPLPAQASQIEFGLFNAVFDGVATLGLLVSALMVFLGYRLMLKGVGQAMPGSNVKLGMKFLNIAISRAAPGVIFAALGCVGMVASLWHFAK